MSLQSNNSVTFSQFVRFRKGFDLKEVLIKL